MVTIAWRRVIGKTGPGYRSLIFRIRRTRVARLRSRQLPPGISLQAPPADRPVDAATGVIVPPEGSSTHGLRVAGEPDDANETSTASGYLNLFDAGWMETMNGQGSRANSFNVADWQSIVRRPLDQSPCCRDRQIKCIPIRRNRKIAKIAGSHIVENVS